MTMRIGLLGRGRWSSVIARTLATFPDVCLIPVEAQDGAHSSLDGVIIANRSSGHAAAALPYLEAGVATFIEKPMTTSVADAEQIRRVATSSGAPILVGHIHLYNPAFERLLAALPELGPIDYIICEGANNRPRDDSSVLWDWLPHDISMLQTIFGAPPDLVAAWKLCQEPVPNIAVVRFSFGAKTCVSTISWRSVIGRRSVTIVAGGKGLVFDDRAVRKLSLYSENGTCSYLRFSEEAPLSREMAAFLNIVRTRQATLSSVDLAVSICRCIAAAERSIRLDGETVQISDCGL